MAEGGHTEDLHGAEQDDGDWEEDFEDEDGDDMVEGHSSEDEDDPLNVNILEAIDGKGDGDESSKFDKNTTAETDVDKKTWELLNTVANHCYHLYIYAPRIDLNLMHDFTESDLFTIDGDSILADIFAQPGLDFSHGGQVLHLVYLVELFLKDFQEREGQFHVIFFTAADTMWHSHPLELFIRRAVIKHLIKNTSCHVVTNIPHPYSQQWKAYLDRYHPAFVMLSDGECLLKQKGRRFLIHALLMSSVRKDVDCAFCSTMRRSLRSVNAFYVEARKVYPYFLTRRKDEDIALAYRVATMCFNKVIAESYIDHELTEICNQLLSIVENHKGSGQQMSTSRDVITVIACAEVMKERPHRGEEDLDKAFLQGGAQSYLLHAALLEYLSLEDRAQNTPDDKLVSPDSRRLMSNFLQRMHYALARLLASYDQLCKNLSKLDGIKETKSLADMMDGRLLYVILYQLQKYTENDIEATYPAEIHEKFRYLWSITCSLAKPGESDSVSPPEKQQLEDKFILRAPVRIYESTSQELESESNLSSNTKGLVPVSSQIVTDYAGDLLKELEAKGDVNLQSVTASPRIFVEKYHWHTGKPLKDHFETTKEDKFYTANASNSNIADLIKELTSIQLHKLYPALGLQSQEILKAEAQGGRIPEEKAKKVLEHWRRKEGYNATVSVILEALEECQYTEAKDKLQAKWNKPEQLSDFERKWQLKNKQLFARYMQNYGESLEGRALGLTQQTITVDRSKAGRKQESRCHKGQKNKQVVGRKEKILQAKEQKDREKADEDAGAKWSAILPDIKLDISRRKYKAALKRMDNFLDHCNSDKWTVKVMLAKMGCNWIAWKTVETAKETREIEHSTFSDVTEKHPMYYPIMLFVGFQEILELKGMLTKKQVHLVSAYMRGLGFQSLADDIQGVASDNSTSYKGLSKPLFSEKLPLQNECSIGMTCTRFQLEFVGQWMKRNERIDKDPRVDHFIPDTWQRELLDAVDQKRSALIVAPTSSGKTYASYYCMEKVLKQGNDGIVVYVSPTKALMNQVSATVYARFNKKYPTGSGKTVCGVFSRDFRRNALTCQILITVPQCLEILLLSPCRQEWAKKIQYVIFDEVHCLGGEIGAEVWEHLLVAIRCPFLALSATVRNPEDICGWLQASQDFKRHQAEEVLKQHSKKKNKNKSNTKIDSNAYKVGLVVWGERHSDLEKFVYLPKAEKCDLTMPSNQILSDTAEFVPLHPVAVLDINKVKSQGLPPDLTLSPREALVLYDTMKDVYPGCQKLKALDPELYFKDILILKKQDVRKYECDLKDELIRWIQSDDEQKVCEVIDNLKRVVAEKVQICKEEWNNADIAEKLKGGPFTDAAAILNYAKLIRQLNKQNKLPAIVFSQSRWLCEALAAEIARSLEKTEGKLRKEFEQTEGWKGAQKTMSRLEKIARRTKDKEDDGTTRGNQRGMQRRPERDDTNSERFEACLQEANASEEKELMDAKWFLLNDPIPSCTLQGEGNLTKEEVDEQLKRLPYTGNLRWMISRGVAYHHAGMNSKQRVAVETLFRMKHLKVVTATSTLALGIHMPCKTVIFACEDLWLKPLSYRQMSGRAGRRGFDQVGNVIFYCVPPQKIQHLITSDLPHLRGHFPFSVSLVLRLMVLTYNSDDKRDAHEKVLALLKHPFVCHKAKDMEELVKHFFLFSVDYLIHAGLLDMNGTPIGLSGLTTHLFYHEPANLTFVTMLQEGAFHELCKPEKDGSFSSSVMETLVLVLAHMFDRKMMPLSTVERMRTQGVHSEVVFGCPLRRHNKDSLKLPSEFSDILKKHNNDVLDVFRGYVHTVCDYAAKRGYSVKQNVLPLSKIAIQPTNLSAPHMDILAEQGNLIARLQAISNKSTTLCPFVMTSGNTDKDLPKIDVDISQVIRQGVHIELSKIPTLLPAEDLKDNRGIQLFINAFAYDFFKHGSQKLVQRENRLQSGEAFDMLKDFNLVISAISVALEELGPQEDNVVLAFKQLKNEYSAKFKQSCLV